MAMGKAFIKGGTPMGSESLCRTCSRALIMTGFRESEMVTMCNWTDPCIVVPFTIYECTGYYDKNRPSWEEMKKFALHISPGNPKPVGFKVGAGFQSVASLVPEDDGEDEDED